MMRDGIKTLSEMIMAGGRETQKGITFVNGAKENQKYFVSYCDLYQMALHRLGVLQKIGVLAGDKVVFQIIDNKEFVISFWSCILGGIIPVPIAVGENEAKTKKLFNVMDIILDAYIIADMCTINKLLDMDQSFYNRKYRKRMEQRTICLESKIGGAINGTIFESKEEDTAFIQFSSGSTGNPKGVVLSHANLIANLTDIISKANITTLDSTLSWLPLTHDMGLIGFHLVPMFAEINQYIMPTELFARNPILWMEKIDEYRTTLISSPNFGYKLFLSFLDRAQKRNTDINWDLSCIRLIFNGAEPISVETSTEFMNRLEKYGLDRCAMYYVYGMAEACLGVTFPKAGNEHRSHTVNIHSLSIGNRAEFLHTGDRKSGTLLLADCGSELECITIKIADKEGNELPEGCVGRIHIRGKNVTHGYFNLKKYTDSVIDGDGWLNTGDIGLKYEGSLLVTGREKDIIIINGINYYASDIEELCEKKLGIRPGKIAACSIREKSLGNESLAIFLSHSGKNFEKFKESALEVRRLLVHALGVEVGYVLPIADLPKTTSGKVQRFRIVEQYNLHLFDEIIDELYGNQIESNQQVTLPINRELEAKLCEIARKVLEIKGIDPDSSIHELGLSSLKLLQLQEAVEKQYPGSIKVSDFYQYDTIREIAEFIFGRTGVQEKTKDNDSKKNMDKRIAITGIDVKLPGADNIDELRTIFCGDMDVKSMLSELRAKDVVNNFPDAKKMGFSEGYYLDRIDTFDWEFFGITPREAALLNPAQRIFLQSAYRAIQDAGYTEDMIRNTETGVYLGYMSDYDNYKYKEIIMETGEKEDKELSVAGNLSSIIPGRLSYYLNLKGPSMLVDTACSSSLVALYMASQAIINGDCTGAVVGGIRIKVNPARENAKLGIESESNVLKAFDDSADGTVEGEGCISIFIKDYQKAKADGDLIYAVILGGAVNQDGKTASITSPGVNAQCEVLQKAWKISGISPEQLEYIEAHGTGTKVGDIIELEGIRKAFEKHTKKKQFCALGTAKGTFGHTYDLAGLLGVVRVVLQLRYKELYPTANIKIPNSKFDFMNAQIWINDQYQPWTCLDKRIAGISAFGFSGTNCHMVLQEEEIDEKSCQKGKSEILYITARSGISLRNIIGAYTEKLKWYGKDKYTSFCYTVNRYAEKFREYRVMIEAENYLDMIGKMERTVRYLDGLGEIEKGIILAFPKEMIGKPDQNHPQYDLAASLLAGKPIEWKVAEKKCSRVRIPGYEFQNTRVWYTADKVYEKNKMSSLPDTHQFGWKEIKLWNHPIQKTRNYVISASDDMGQADLEIFRGFKHFNVKNIENLWNEFLQQKLTEAAHIVYIPVRKTSSSIEELQSFINRDIFQLISVLKELDRQKNITFTIMLKNSFQIFEGEVVIPEYAMMAALIRNISIEMPQIKFCILDYSESAEDEAVYKALMNCERLMLSVRGNKYFIPSILETRADVDKKYKGLIRNGNYLITGGNGVVGSFLAHYLSKEYEANVILVGRSKSAEINTEKLDRKKVIYISCDISNQDAVHELMAHLKNMEITLNGVFHLAGISGNGILLKKTAKQIEEVAAPKVYGTFNLLNALKKNSLDFFMTFSSGMTVFPDFGQADYVMANQYMDAVAESASIYNQRILSVDLPVVYGEGMAEQNNYDNHIIYPMELNCIPDTIEMILTHFTGRLLLGSWRDNENKEIYLKKYGYFNKSKGTNLQTHKKVHVKSRNEMKKLLLDMIKHATGLNALQEDENFLTKGVDSLLIVRIHKQIEEMFPGKLSVSQMFTINTVDMLAEILYEGTEKENDGFAEQIENWYQMIDKGEMSVEDMAEQVALL